MVDIDRLCIEFCIMCGRENISLYSLYLDRSRHFDSTPVESAFVSNVGVSLPRQYTRNIRYNPYNIIAALRSIKANILLLLDLRSSKTLIPSSTTELKHHVLPQLCFCDWSCRNCRRRQR